MSIKAMLPMMIYCRVLHSSTTPRINVANPLLKAFSINNNSPIVSCPVFLIFAGRFNNFADKVLSFEEFQSKYGVGSGGCTHCRRRGEEVPFRSFPSPSFINHHVGFSYLYDSYHLGSLHTACVIRRIWKVLPLYRLDKLYCISLLSLPLLHFSSSIRICITLHACHCNLKF